MSQQSLVAVSLNAPFQDCYDVFTKPSLVSFQNYLHALCSEMRSFSVLGFTDLLDLPYDQHDYFISRAVWDERELNRKRLHADFQNLVSSAEASAPSKTHGEARIPEPFLKALPFLESAAEPGRQAYPLTLLSALERLSLKRVHLIVDDSAIRKFTSCPYFVDRGHIGNLGKVDRCLSSVFSCFSDGQFITPFEVDPYLPSSKLAAGKDNFEFRSKLELALSQINRAFFLAQEVGFDVGFTLFDIWYGAAWFLNTLHEGGATYFGQVRSTRTLKLGKQKGSLLRLVTASKSEPTVIQHQGKQVEVRSLVGRLAKVNHEVKAFVIKVNFSGKRETCCYVSDDLSLTEEEAVTLAFLRWDIDYFFREAKTYLAMAEGKFQKKRCYLRHFYLTFMAWSVLRLAIKLHYFKNVKTIFRAVRALRKSLQN